MKKLVAVLLVLILFVFSFGYAFTLERIPNQCVVTTNTKDKCMVAIDKHCLWKFTDKPLVITKVFTRFLFGEVIRGIDA